MVAIIPIFSYVEVIKVDDQDPDRPIVMLRDKIDTEDFWARKRLEDTVMLDTTHSGSYIATRVTFRDGEEGTVQKIERTIYYKDGGKIRVWDCKQNPPEYLVSKDFIDYAKNMRLLDDLGGSILE